MQGEGGGGIMDPVHRAAKANDFGQLYELLEEDPELVHARDSTFPFFRPLTYACEAGSLNAAWLLLERGAQMEQWDVFRHSALMHACQYGRLEVVSMLLERGADPMARSGYEHTPLMCACLSLAHGSCDPVGVLRLLLKDARVQVNARDMGGQTALHYACREGHSELVRVLLMEGSASARLADRQGKTPMDVARAHEGCVQLLKVRYRFSRAVSPHVMIGVPRARLLTLLLLKMVQWYSHTELEKLYALSKARALVDHAEDITHATEGLKKPKTRAKVRPTHTHAHAHAHKVPERYELPGRGECRAMAAKSALTMLCSVAAAEAGGTGCRQRPFIGA